MKHSRFALWSLLVLGATFARAQDQSVAELVQGSEFKYTKGNIDIETISSLIADRQKAISRDVLHRYLVQSQAGALSQNFLNERLLDQLLNSNSPKEINKGIYTYAMESFALGFLADALGSDAKFQIPGECNDALHLPLGKAQIPRECWKALEGKQELKTLVNLNSALVAIQESREFLSGQISGRGGKAPISMHQVIDHAVEKIKAQDSSSKLIRSYFRATWIAYPKAPPTLAKAHRQYLRDLAYKISVDNNRLFSRTLFQKAENKEYSARTMQAMFDERWKLDSGVFDSALNVLDSGIFKNANQYREEIQEQLRRDEVVQFLAENGGEMDGLRSQFKSFNNRIRVLKDRSAKCDTISESGSIPEIFEAIGACKDDLRSMYDSCATDNSKCELYSAWRRTVDTSQDLEQILELLDPMALVGRRNSDSVMVFLGDKIRKGESVEKMENLLSHLSELRVVNQQAMEKDRIGLVFKDSMKGVRPLDSVLKSRIQVVLMDASSGRDVSVDEVKKAKEGLVRKIKGVTLLYSNNSSAQEATEILNRSREFQSYSKIAGGSDALKGQEKLIRAALLVLNQVVVRDSQAVRFLSSYDQFLKMWILSESGIRDSLGLLFLKQYLPKLRNLSFSDSGLKSAYMRSRALVEYVNSRSKKAGDQRAVISPAIKWLGAYSTRKRSQNLQSALQILRENDSLFNKVLPDSGAREWFWLVTGGLEIDTAADVIAMDIPKMLTKIEKKYQAVAKKEMRFYPVLDIGIFMARVADNNSDTVQWAQMASEKVGVGFRFWEAEPCPSEALVEDPTNATGACTNPYLEKMGVEAFGSGLLYNTTNLKTEKTFNDFVFSLGFAAHFRLGLVARAAHGWGFNGGKFQHHVTQFAMDVPLADYLVELSKKKK